MKSQGYCGDPLSELFRVTHERMMPFHKAREKAGDEMRKGREIFVRIDPAKSCFPEVREAFAKEKQ
jgi:hypothetical protein